MGDTGYHSTQPAASPEHTKCPRSRVFTWIPRYACGADSEQDPAAFPLSGGIDQSKVVPTLCVALPPISRLPVFFSLSPSPFFTVFS